LLSFKAGIGAVASKEKIKPTVVQKGLDFGLGDQTYSCC